MRSNFPARPQGTHTWIRATFLPPNTAIIMRSGDHIFIWAHPTSPYAGNQKHIHHLVSVGRTMGDGEVSVETVSRTLARVNAGHVRCFQRYLDRGIKAQEIPAMMTAYGILVGNAVGVPPDEVDRLRGSLQRLLTAA